MIKRFFLICFLVGAAVRSDALNLGDLEFQALKRDFFDGSSKGDRVKVEQCLDQAKLHELEDFINWQNEDGDTALILAAKFDNEPVVRFLLERRADPDILNLKSESAAYWAIKNKNRDMVGVLLGFGKAEVNYLVTEEELPLLWIAILSGNQEVIDVLKQRGALFGDFDCRNYINKIGDDSATLLLRVIERSGENLDSWNVVRHLLWLGGDPNIVNRSFNNALALAVSIGDAKIVKVLLESKKVNFDKKEIMRLLDLAKTMKYEEVVQLLNQEKADHSWWSWLTGK